MLYRSTDRLCRRGAPMQNLAHSASFESLDKDAPSKSGTKHLAFQSTTAGRARITVVWDTGIEPSLWVAFVLRCAIARSLHPRLDASLLRPSYDRSAHSS